MKIDFEECIKSGVDQAMKDCELTIGMTLKEAVEKQVAKKPSFEGDGYDPDGNLVYDTWICPCCEKHYEVDYEEYDYCPSCGQRIDWSDQDGLE